MKLSKKTEYALRALSELALHADQGNLQSQELSRRENIPVKFLEQILLVLKNAGILQSRRGAGGGYTLNRPAVQITLGEVIRLIEGPLTLLECIDGATPDNCSCSDETTCGIRDVMADVSRGIAGLVDSITLADICDRTRELRKQKSFTPLYSI